MGEPVPQHPEEADPSFPTPRQRSTWRKAQRLRLIEDALRVRPMSSRDLAGLCGEPIRTVQRALEDLEQMGRGVERRDGRYFIPGPREPLNPVEVLTVHAAVRLLYHHAPAHHAQYVQTLHKIARNLPGETRRVLDESIVTHPGRPGDDGTLERVALAWERHQVLRFDYRRPNGEVERGNELCVYFVEVSRANLAPYVIGLERRHRGRVRTFKLSRMLNPLTLAETYTIPPDFNPRDYLTDAWGVIGGENPITVSLRFTPDAAYRIREGGYPNTGEPQPLPDGGVRLDIRAGTDNTGLPRELIPWILSWGPRVEVLEPDFVRAHWLGELRAALRRHDPGFAHPPG